MFKIYKQSAKTTADYILTNKRWKGGHYRYSDDF